MVTFALVGFALLAVVVLACARWGRAHHHVPVLDEAAAAANCRPLANVTRPKLPEPS
jgi:hypothetical protein